MRILSVVGARPQFVKLAPMHKEISKEDEHIILHTGQHYDRLLSQSFFEELSLPEPEINLNVGSSSHGAQTGRIMELLEPQLDRIAPDWVLVYGDTNSTLATTIAAVKKDYRVAHLEAGLRSRNRKMPEEHNRILTDHAADLCLAPSRAAMLNLRAEGLASTSRFVGDVMLDALLSTLKSLGIPREKHMRSASEHYIATIHRQENTDDPGRLRAILNSLNNLNRSVHLHAHPRLLSKLKKSGIQVDSFNRIEFLDSLPYPQLISDLASARGLITDSGGLQKEAFFLETPCVTLRNETEWPETVELGWNFLSKPDSNLIGNFFSNPPPRYSNQNPYGIGNAAGSALKNIREAC